MTGTVAYIVNRRAAEKLVQKLLPMTDVCDEAMFQGRVGIREATVFPNCIILHEHSNQSTIQESDKRKRNLKPWHFVFWSCRLFRLRVRVVRYILQVFRLIQRRCVINPSFLSGFFFKNRFVIRPEVFRFYMISFANHFSIIAISLSVKPYNS